MEEARPKVRYLAELTPIASSPAEDPGPGARRKDEKGEWLIVGNHRLEGVAARRTAVIDQ